MASFVKLMAKFWQKNYDNSNVIGNIDFSMFNAFYYSCFFHTFLFLKFSN